MCEMCREEQLVLSLLITITVPVFLKVSFVFTSVNATSYFVSVYKEAVE